MSDGPVLLYDGLCGFCDGTVQFILKHDRRGLLRFATLQGDFARGVIDRHPELGGIDSLVLVDRYVPESPIRSPSRVDVPGGLLLSGALLSLMVGLTEGEHWGWTSPLLLGVLALGAAFLVLWGVVESRSETSMFSRNPNGTEVFIPFSTAYHRGDGIIVIEVNEWASVNVEHTPNELPA